MNLRPSVLRKVYHIHTSSASINIHNIHRELMFDSLITFRHYYFNGLTAECYQKMADLILSNYKDKRQSDSLNRVAPLLKII